MRDKAAERGDVPCNFLYPLYVLNWAHPHDGRDLLRVGFDATLRDDEAKLHTPQDPQNALLGVELNAISLEFCEGLLKVGYDLVSLFGLDHDVIHVGLNDLPDEIPQTLEHAALVCSPHILQAERHCDIAERSEWGDERCHELVGLFHRDLMVPGVRIKEAKSFTP